MWSAPVGEGANLTRRGSCTRCSLRMLCRSVTCPAPMLIGAHVSPAGGLAKAVERGVERNCEAIQIFHQSPGAWRPTKFGPADHESFTEAFAASQLEAVAIHSVYLINTATP